MTIQPLLAVKLLAETKIMDIMKLAGEASKIGLQPGQDILNEIWETFVEVEVINETAQILVGVPTDFDMKKTKALIDYLGKTEVELKIMLELSTM